MDLKNVNEALHNEKQNMMLLAFLLDSFEHFTNTLVQEHTMIILKKVKSTLFYEEWQKKLQKDNLVQDMVQDLVIQGRDARSW